MNEKITAHPQKEEREKVLKEIRQLENRKKILENKQRNEERRVRTRRLIERGVRFVQIFHESWDQHGDLKGGLTRNCQATDKPSAALVRDLKQRGLLEDTIVVWGGEFGRTPMVQGGDDGRDHHPNGFSYWVAGGGFKPGISWGETDDFGFNAVKDKVHVHDFHATLLNQLGFHHEKLTYRFQGRDFRLTDVHGEVVSGLLA